MISTPFKRQEVNMNEKNSLNKEYIQFSKKLAKWAIISLLAIVFCAYGIISFVDLNTDQVESAVEIVQAGTVAVGLVVASYMGNSGVEKVVHAKYKMEQMTNGDDGDGAG